MDLDVLLWMVLWVIGVILWYAVPWGWRRFVAPHLSGRCAALCGASEPAAPAPALSGAKDLEAGEGSVRVTITNPSPGVRPRAGATGATAPNAGSSGASGAGGGGGAGSNPVVALGVRWVLPPLACLGGCYLFVVMIIAIYVGSSGGSLVFEPVVASACQVAPCAEDGDINCCSYDASLVLPSTPPTDVTFEDENGNLIHGWVLENATAPAGNPDAPFVNILYNHGSGYNVAVKYRLDRYKFLLAQGRVRILAFDYPGYGKSGGSPTEDSVKASARAAMNFFEERLGFPAGSGGRNITVLGRSLGGGVAVWLTNDPAGTEVRSLILQSTFTSLLDVADNGFPVVGWVIRLLFVATFDSLGLIPTYGAAAEGSGVPACLFQSHSRDDALIDFADAEKLFDAASLVPASPPTNCKDFYAYSGAGHDSPLTTGEMTALAAWLAIQRGR